MRSVRFGLAWTFIVLVAAYDSHFAWQHRRVLLTWEMNPVACWTFELLGLEAVFLFKALGLAFAMGLAGYCHVRRPRLETPFTLIIGCVYLLLSVHYLIGHLSQFQSVSGL
jgi:hypothetical protein